MPPRLLRFGGFYQHTAHTDVIVNNFPTFILNSFQTSLSECAKLSLARAKAQSYPFTGLRQQANRTLSGGLDVLKDDGSCDSCLVQLLQFS